MKYCKVISAVMGSVLLFIMVSVFVPVYADAQDFDKSIVTNIDEIITEYPAAVHTFMYRHHNAIISSKFRQKRLDRITEAYEEACAREPSWIVYCSACYGFCLMSDYNPDSVKTRGAKILEDALDNAAESQLPLSERVNFTIDLANVYLRGKSLRIVL